MDLTLPAHPHYNSLDRMHCLPFATAWTPPPSYYCRSIKPGDWTVTLTNRHETSQAIQTGRSIHTYHLPIPLPSPLDSTLHLPPLHTTTALGPPITLPLETNGTTHHIPHWLHTLFPTCPPIGFHCDQAPDLPTHIHLIWTCCATFLFLHGEEATSLTPGSNGSSTHAFAARAPPPPPHYRRTTTYHVPPPHLPPHTMQDRLTHPPAHLPMPAAPPAPADHMHAVPPPLVLLPLYDTIRSTSGLFITALP